MAVQHPTDNETARLEAFSDGVFAIAITLLVLDLKVPANLAQDQSLLGALADQWPAYFGFLTSFATIGIMWINHHHLFGMICRFDHPLLVLNAFLLLGVTFIPFPTAVMAAYVEKPGAETAALFYSLTFVVIAIAFTLLWRHASGERKLIDPSVEAWQIEQINRAFRIGPATYVFAAMVAPFSPPVSVAIILLLALFWALPAHVRARLPGIG
jgi:uncharacterized membrane protein